MNIKLLKEAIINESLQTSLFYFNDARIEKLRIKTRMPGSVLLNVVSDSCYQVLFYDNMGYQDSTETYSNESEACQRVLDYLRYKKQEFEENDAYIRENYGKSL